MLVDFHPRWPHFQLLFSTGQMADGNFLQTNRPTNYAIRTCRRSNQAASNAGGQLRNSRLPPPCPLWGGGLHALRILLFAWSYVGTDFTTSESSASWYSFTVGSRLRVWPRFDFRGGPVGTQKKKTQAYDACNGQTPTHTNEMRVKYNAYFCYIYAREQTPKHVHNIPDMYIKQIL